MTKASTKEFAPELSAPGASDDEIARTLLTEREDLRSQPVTSNKMRNEMTAEKLPEEAELQRVAKEFVAKHQGT